MSCAEQTLIHIAQPKCPYPTLPSRCETTRAASSSSTWLASSSSDVAPIFLSRPKSIAIYYTPMSDFKRGDKILHPMFGPGEVAAVSGSGADAKLTIDFAPSVGRKKLLAGVVNLKKADGDTPVAAPA